MYEQDQSVHTDLFVVVDHHIARLRQVKNMVSVFGSFGHNWEQNGIKRQNWDDLGIIGHHWSGIALRPFPAAPQPSACPLAPPWQQPGTLKLAFQQQQANL
jgi:hypothetical protein